MSPSLCLRFDGVDDGGEEGSAELPGRVSASSLNDSLKMSPRRHVSAQRRLSLCRPQLVPEAEPVPAGAGAAAELDPGGGGGRLRAPAHLVHAGGRRERPGRPGRRDASPTEKIVFFVSNRVIIRLCPRLCLWCRRAG